MHWIWKAAKQNHWGSFPEEAKGCKARRQQWHCVHRQLWLDEGVPWKWDRWLCLRHSQRQNRFGWQMFLALALTVTWQYWDHILRLSFWHPSSKLLWKEHFLSPLIKSVCWHFPYRSHFLSPLICPLKFSIQVSLLISAHLSAEITSISLTLSAHCMKFAKGLSTKAVKATASKLAHVCTGRGQPDKRN